MSATHKRGAAVLCAQCGKRPAVTLMKLASGATAVRHIADHDQCRQCRASAIDAAHARLNRGTAGQVTHARMGER